MLPPRWRELETAEDADGWATEAAATEAAKPAGDAATVGATADAAGEAAAAEEEAGMAAKEEGDGAEDEEEEEAEDGGFEEAAVAPLLFYGVRGQQMREGDAPSYFNPLEVSDGGPAIVAVSLGVWRAWRPQLPGPAPPRQTHASLPLCSLLRRLRRWWSW